MLRALPVLIIVTLLSGCAPKADLDKAQAEVTRLEKQVAELEQEKIALTAQLGEASARLSRKPLMPVKVSLRRAFLGGGYVAVFSTKIKESLPILVTVKSEALGTSRQYRVNLDSSGTSELGSSQGAAIDTSDELILENTKFETSTVRFHKP